MNSRAPTRLEPGRIRRSGGGRKALVTETSRRLERAGRARGARRSDVAVALGLARVAPSRGRTRRPGASREPYGRGRIAEAAEVQPSGALIRKTREGDSHPDRDAQFAYINTEVSAALAEGQAVIPVDTKKKELVGDFKNAGREWRCQGEPEEVRVHDFLIKELGRAVPYGIYDLASNAGWVSVGITHDTAAFAVQTICRWWQEIGRARYPEATRLVITADGGGSNGYRVRLWETRAATSGRRDRHRH